MLVPSSGFTARVMGAVSDAAVSPEPLPFPWVRFLAGVLAALVSLASAAALVTSPWASALSATLRAIADATPAIVYAAVVTVACLAVLRFHTILMERDA